MGPDDVTAGWLSGILDGDIGSIEHARIGDGLVGLNLRVILVDAAPGLPSSVVLKLPSLDPTSRATGIALRNYEREVKFYTQLASTVDIRVPRCFHGEWDAATGDFVLVLEDMTPADTGDQVAGCDAVRARAAVEELAKLHGPRWDDDSLADIDWLARRTGPEDVTQMQLLWQMFFPAFATIYRPHLSDEAFELVEWFGGHLGEWIDGRDGPHTVTHGDYRLDNLLFATTPDCPPVTVVDWQSPGDGPPIGDLSYFCGAGLLPADRRTHERSLVEAYRDGLVATGVRIEDEWLWEQYRREAFGGVIMAVIASQLVGSSDRSEAMFTAMATRHLQHALDLDARSLI